MNPQDPTEIIKNYHIDQRLTRFEYEGLCKPLLERIKTPMKQALADARLTTNQIAQTILIGGSTRMPCISQLIKKFTSAPVNSSLNPDEAVTLGAAVPGSGILRPPSAFLSFSVALTHGRRSKQLTCSKCGQIY